MQPIKTHATSRYDLYLCVFHQISRNRLNILTPSTFWIIWIAAGQVKLSVEVVLLQWQFKIQATYINEQVAKGSVCQGCETSSSLVRGCSCSCQEACALCNSSFISHLLVKLYSTTCPE